MLCTLEVTWCEALELGYQLQEGLVLVPTSIAWGADDVGANCGSGEG